MIFWHLQISGKALNESALKLLDSVDLSSFVSWANFYFAMIVELIISSKSWLKLTDASPNLVLLMWVPGSLHLMRQ